MKRFAALFEALDTTTATGLKIAAMADYFRAAPPADAVWALYILSGRRPRRLIGPALLRRWLELPEGRDDRDGWEVLHRRAPDAAARARAGGHLAGLDFELG